MMPAPSNAPAAADPRRGWPLATISAARTVLDLNEDEVVSRIEDGRILFAWNIAVSTDARRKELRILPAALADYRAERQCNLTLPQAVDQVLPSDAAHFATPLISRALNCGATHIVALIKAGFLMAISGWRRGPGGAALITRASFLQFLNRRRWPAPVES